jgi:hypothetical protein
VSAAGSQPPRRPSPPAGRPASEPAREGGGRTPSRAAAPRRPRPDGEGPSFLAMIGVVAVVVALVIVVFFVFGYVLGRIFL